MQSHGSGKGKQGSRRNIGTDGEEGPQSDEQQPLPIGGSDPITTSTVFSTELVLVDQSSRENDVPPLADGAGGPEHAKKQQHVQPQHQPAVAVHEHDRQIAAVHETLPRFLLRGGSAHRASVHRQEGRGKHAVPVNDRGGDGDARASAGGGGNARAFNEGDGNAHAFNEGDENAHAFTEGDGNAHAFNEGDGHAHAFTEGDGNARAVTEGVGNAHAFQEGAGDVYTSQEGEGNTHVFREGALVRDLPSSESEKERRAGRQGGAISAPKRSRTHTSRREISPEGRKTPRDTGTSSKSAFFRKLDGPSGQSPHHRMPETRKQESGIIRDITIHGEATGGTTGDGTDNPKFRAYMRELLEEGHGRSCVGALGDHRPNYSEAQWNKAAADVREYPGLRNREGELKRRPQAEAVRNVPKQTDAESAAEARKSASTVLWARDLQLYDEMLKMLNYSTKQNAPNPSRHRMAYSDDEWALLVTQAKGELRKKRIQGLNDIANNNRPVPKDLHVISELWEKLPDSRKDGFVTGDHSRVSDDDELCERLSYHVDLSNPTGPQSETSLNAAAGDRRREAHNWIGDETAKHRIQMDREREQIEHEPRQEDRPELPDMHHKGASVCTSGDKCKAFIFDRKLKMKHRDGSVATQYGCPFIHTQRQLETPKPKRDPAGGMWMINHPGKPPYRHRQPVLPHYAPVTEDCADATPTPLRTLDGDYVAPCEDAPNAARVSSPPARPKQRMNTSKIVRSKDSTLRNGNPTRTMAAASGAGSRLPSRSESGAGKGSEDSALTTKKLRQREQMKRYREFVETNISRETYCHKQAVWDGQTEKMFFTWNRQKVDGPFSGKWMKENEELIQEQSFYEDTKGNILKVQFLQPRAPRQMVPHSKSPSTIAGSAKLKTPPFMMDTFSHFISYEEGHKDHVPNHPDCPLDHRRMCYVQLKDHCASCPKAANHEKKVCPLLSERQRCKLRELRLTDGPQSVNPTPATSTIAASTVPMSVYASQKSSFPALKQNSSIQATPVKDSSSKTSKKRSPKQTPSNRKDSGPRGTPHNPQRFQISTPRLEPENPLRLAMGALCNFATKKDTTLMKADLTLNERVVVGAIRKHGVAVLKVLRSALAQQPKFLEQTKDPCVKQSRKLLQKTIENGANLPCFDGRNGWRIFCPHEEKVEHMKHWYKYEPGQDELVFCGYRPHRDDGRGSPASGSSASGTGSVYSGRSKSQVSGNKNFSMKRPFSATEGQHGWDVPYDVNSESDAEECAGSEFQMARMILERHNLGQRPSAMQGKRRGRSTETKMTYSGKGSAGKHAGTIPMVIPAKVLNSVELSESPAMASAQSQRSAWKSGCTGTGLAPQNMGSSHCAGVNQAPAAEQVPTVRNPQSCGNEQTGTQQSSAGFHQAGGGQSTTHATHMPAQGASHQAPYQANQPGDSSNDRTGAMPNPQPQPARHQQVPTGAHPGTNMGNATHQPQTDDGGASAWNPDEWDAYRGRQEWGQDMDSQKEEPNPSVDHVSSASVASDLSDDNYGLKEPSSWNINQTDDYAEGFPGLRKVFRTPDVRKHRELDPDNRRRDENIHGWKYIHEQQKKRYDAGMRANDARNNLEKDYLPRWDHRFPIWDRCYRLLMWFKKVFIAIGKDAAERCYQALETHMPVNDANALSVARGAKESDICPNILNILETLYLDGKPTSLGAEAQLHDGLLKLKRRNHQTYVSYLREYEHLLVTAANRGIAIPMDIGRFVYANARVAKHLQPHVHQYMSQKMHPSWSFVADMIFYKFGDDNPEGAGVDNPPLRGGNGVDETLNPDARKVYERYLKQHPPAQTSQVGNMSMNRSDKRVNERANQKPAEAGVPARRLTRKQKRAAAKANAHPARGGGAYPVAAPGGVPAATPTVPGGVPAPATNPPPTDTAFYGNGEKGGKGGKGVHGGADTTPPLTLKHAKWTKHERKQEGDETYTLASGEKCPANLPKMCQNMPLCPKKQNCKDFTTDKPFKSASGADMIGCPYVHTKSWLNEDLRNEREKERNAWKAKNPGKEHPADRPGKGKKGRGKNSNGGGGKKGPK